MPALGTSYSSSVKYTQIKLLSSAWTLTFPFPVPQLCSSCCCKSTVSTGALISTHGQEWCGGVIHCVCIQKHCMKQIIECKLPPLCFIHWIGFLAKRKFKKRSTWWRCRHCERFQLFRNESAGGLWPSGALNLFSLHLSRAPEKLYKHTHIHTQTHAYLTGHLSSPQWAEDLGSLVKMRNHWLKNWGNCCRFSLDKQMMADDWATCIRVVGV